MATSLNGWTAIFSYSSPMLRTIEIPGTGGRTVQLRRVCAPLFAAFYADWQQRMTSRLKLNTGPIDGFEPRDARGGGGISNHGSGTAVDVRYDVLLADRGRHMTNKEIQIVHDLLDEYVDDQGRRVFGWGGDWEVGTWCDEMHLELAQGWAIGAQGRATTRSDVKNVMKRLGINRDGIRTKR